MRTETSKLMTHLADRKHSCLMLAPSQLLCYKTIPGHTHGVGPKGFFTSARLACANLDPSPPLQAETTKEVCLTTTVAHHRLPVATAARSHFSTSVM